MAKWDDHLYNRRKKEMVNEANAKFCSIVEWVEQPMPDQDNAIRETVRGGEPFLPSDILESIPEEKVEETGKMNVIA